MQGLSEVEVQQRRLPKKSVQVQNLKRVGSVHVEPILSEEEEEAEVNKLFLQAYMNHEINTAKMIGNPLDVLLAIKKCTFPFDGSVDRLTEVFQQWLLDYFLQRSNINIASDHLSARIDVGIVSNSNIVSPTKFIVYGTDFMTTHNVIDRFGGIMRWIDSSHCIVDFQSEQLAIHYIFKLYALQQQSIDVEESFALRNWIEIKGYTNLSFSRKLFLRHLTDEDELYVASLQKNPKPYDRYKATLKSLQMELLKDDTIRGIYETKLEEEMASKMIGPNEFTRRKNAMIDKMQGDKSSFVQTTSYLKSNSNNKSFNSKQSRYEEKMLRKLKRPEDIGQQRYTLEFYKDYYENSKKMHKQQKSRKFMQSLGQSKLNQSYNSSWKERKYSRNSSRAYERGHRVADALKNAPILKHRYMHQQRILPNQPRGPPILNQSLLDYDSEPLQVQERQNAAVYILEPNVSPAECEIMLNQAHPLGQNAEKEALQKPDALFTKSNISNIDAKAPQSIIPNLSMCSSIPQHSGHSINIQSQSFSSLHSSNLNKGKPKDLSSDKHFEKYCNIKFEKGSEPSKSGGVASQQFFSSGMRSLDESENGVAVPQPHLGELDEISESEQHNLKYEK